MKKTLIIFALLLGLIWLVAMPAVVGGYLDRALPDWLDEAGMSRSAQYDPGWFRSQLSVNDDYRLDLSARHVPPLGLAWLRFDGELQAALSPAPIEVEGAFGLTGLTSASLRASQLIVDGPVDLRSGAARLALNQSLDQTSTLRWQIEGAELTDRIGNVLAANTAELALAWQPSARDPEKADERQPETDDLDLSLTAGLSADSGPLPILNLELQASPIQRDALADLIQGIQQLTQAQAGSTARRFALLTVAGAWQQLSENGLRLRLNQLQIGADSRFSGQWNTREGQPVLKGEGSIASLTRALQPIVALSARVSADDAERSIRAWLDQLAQRGWLVVDGDRFELGYPAS